MPFVHVARRVDGSPVDTFHERLANHVDRERLCGLDIGGGVLLFSVVVGVAGDDDERGFVVDDVEETKRKERQG